MVQLASPYNYPERLLLFGGPGAGKTQSVLSLARVTGKTFHVLDNDESYAYARALETDFADVADHVHVTEAEPDWESMCEGVKQVTAAADRDAGDFVVIDSASPLWDAVQGYMTETVVGTDVATHMAGMRKSAADLSEFHKALTDTVPWQIIKQEYKNKITVPIRRWKGNLVLTAEGKPINKRDDDQTKDWFGQVGVKPAGEGRLAFITASVLYLEKTKAGMWKLTSIKDRNRQTVEHQEFDDFGVDYLMTVAGWTRVKKQQRED